MQYMDHSFTFAKAAWYNGYQLSRLAGEILCTRSNLLAVANYFRQIKRETAAGIPKLSSGIPVGRSLASGALPIPGLH